jgi:hypothetical protein
VYWGYRFYLFLCICVLRISVLPLSMYLCVEDIGFTSFYVLCVEDIGFTSFYVFDCRGYQFYLFLCIWNRYPQHTNTYKDVIPISSTHKYIERGKTDILNTQMQISVLPLSMYLCIENIGFTSLHVFVCLGYRFYLFLCICVLNISVWLLSTNT